MKKGLRQNKMRMIIGFAGSLDEAHPLMKKGLRQNTSIPNLDLMIKHEAHPLMKKGLRPKFLNFIETSLLFNHEAHPLMKKGLRHYIIVYFMLAPPV